MCLCTDGGMVSHIFICGFGGNLNAHILFTAVCDESLSLYVCLWINVRECLSKCLFTGRGNSHEVHVYNWMWWNVSVHIYLQVDV